ncbi:MAG: type II toxin-antitoxin system VapC family toxin [Gammaproteobacteria bacterium]|nr:type II toxin-antitoxin system VapC family toxin [Gammaproteobacteria bacterium]MYG14076.1 type II toxin-antitoxin system VapC family toxin [Gammaproteobacteria bacterium]MYH13611.1 type II toxin-antitoxin system VapC family toxin [Gammaproteobacteria bacterium]MYK29277.1 type II toxin-antitoxin system VapC family toxin [Gammaproteobacteria bacterium]MYK84591.1 type II toxin-antitoxin system VapC family toxin [Gammaproteobacteria bacterium]
MTQVVDASVLVAALVDDGEDGRWSEISIGRDALVAPELLLVESSNILRRLERAGIISNIEANAAHSDLLRLDVELFPFAPFAERVWALRGNLTGYDAWYVAVAERFECPLLTLDRKLSRATGPMCEFLVP